jgi:hypothetical protein
MKNMIGFSLAVVIGLLSLSWIASSQEQKTNMTFFITSVGSGKGADLGGLAGADKHCQSLAQAVGAGNRTWRAYLSTNAFGGQPAVNARDRIGKGPWQNAKGVVIAKDVDDLHSNNNKINKETALSEKGETINARGDKPNMHDIRTGEHFQATRIGPAATGRAAPPAPRWSAIMIAKDCATTNLRDRGTRPIRRVERIQAVDAAKKGYEAPEATVSSTASRRIN